MNLNNKPNFIRPFNEYQFIVNKKSEQQEFNAKARSGSADNFLVQNSQYQRSFVSTNKENEPNDDGQKEIKRLQQSINYNGQQLEKIHQKYNLLLQEIKKEFGLNENKKVQSCLQEIYQQLNSIKQKQAQTQKEDVNSNIDTEGIVFKYKQSVKQIQNQMNLKAEEIANQMMKKLQLQQQNQSLLRPEEDQDIQNFNQYIDDQMEFTCEHYQSQIENLQKFFDSKASLNDVQQIIKSIDLNAATKQIFEDFNENTIQCKNLQEKHDMDKIVIEEKTNELNHKIQQRYSEISLLQKDLLEKLKQLKQSQDQRQNEIEMQDSFIQQLKQKSSLLKQECDGIISQQQQTFIPNIDFIENLVNQSPQLGQRIEKVEVNVQKIGAQIKKLQQNLESANELLQDKKSQSTYESFNDIPSIKQQFNYSYSSFQKSKDDLKIHLMNSFHKQQHSIDQQYSFKQEEVGIIQQKQQNFQIFPQHNFTNQIEISSKQPQHETTFAEGRQFQSDYKIINSQEDDEFVDCKTINYSQSDNQSNQMKDNSSVFYTPKMHSLNDISSGHNDYNDRKELLEEIINNKFQKPILLRLSQLSNFTQKHKLQIDMKKIKLSLNIKDEDLIKNTQQMMDILIQIDYLGFLLDSNDKYLYDEMGLPIQFKDHDFQILKQYFD